jgi:NTP pyrophosphatase (non-canonical NTP hydrolase)
MKLTWQQRSRGIHERFIQIAKCKGSLTSETDVIHFLALAICGEAGELANVVKKSWRGDEVQIDQIRDEIADIRIYLEHFARYFDIDIDEACEQKLDVVSKRLDTKEQKIPAEASL